MALRILVAEHEFVTAFDLCNTFEEAGYVVEGPHAGICSAALACEKEKPDLALLDVELGDVGTLELAQKLIDDKVPVILHSECEDTSALAARFPHATTLAKPCPPAKLLDTVSRVLMPA
ncbi:MAG: response regulator [Erythrobacter sp.]